MIRRVAALAFAATFCFAQTSWAFCGFYIATTDEPLVNTASRVVLAHHGDRTVVTMASDVHGDPKQFGLVIPVPTVIKRNQVRIVPPETVAHLADYTKPRLVQYFDPDPCPPEPPKPSLWERLFGPRRHEPMAAAAAPAAAVAAPTIHVEAQFSVEEYDIVVLSASDSGDLLTYLNRKGYKIPPQARPVVQSYIRQHLHFFLAKVNLVRMHNNTSGFLRPIQVAYSSRKFMLPIRLGTVNATRPQDMIVLTLTEKGRVETTNYRTVKVPTGLEVPLFVQERFGQFYDAVFDRQVETSDGSAVFLEYAWNIGTTLCDPCSAAPLDVSEYQVLGVDWLQQATWRLPIFVTRLHIRYDRAHFPEDLALQETPDTESFQARYVLQRPYTGNTACEQGRRYEASLPARFAQEAETLQTVTGWLPELIHANMQRTGQKF